MSSGILQDLAIFGAGIAAGMINVIVGSGTLITFPTLLAFNFPPVLANVSNNIGLVPGSVSGVYGYRAELTGQRDRVFRLGAASLCGGLVGAILLLVLPAGAFKAIVPVLIAVSLVMVVAQPKLARWVAARKVRTGASPLRRVGVVSPDGRVCGGPGGSVVLGPSSDGSGGPVSGGSVSGGSVSGDSVSGGSVSGGSVSGGSGRGTATIVAPGTTAATSAVSDSAATSAVSDSAAASAVSGSAAAAAKADVGGPLLWFLVFCTGVYGGYFGAAQGVLLIGLLGVALDDSLQRINAVKNILAALVNGVAGIVFIIVSHVAWVPAALIALGSVLGGQAGARVGRKLPPWGLRALIVCVGVAALAKLLA